MESNIETEGEGQKHEGGTRYYPRLTLAWSRVSRQEDAIHGDRSCLSTVVEVSGDGEAGACGVGVDIRDVFSHL